MNKKQLIEQNEEFFAQMAAKSNELEACRARINELQTSLDQCRVLLAERQESINTLNNEKNILKQKIEAIITEFENYKSLSDNDNSEKQNNSFGAQQNPVVDEYTSITDDSERETAHSDEQPETVEDEPNAVEDEPNAVDNNTAEGFRIPDFGQHEGNFEEFFAENDMQNTVAEDDTDISNLTISADEAETNESKLDKDTQNDNFSKMAHNDTLYNNVYNIGDYPLSSEIYKTDEMRDYCAGLIGRVALAAARVLANINSFDEPVKENIKNIALGKTEAFKAEVIQYLSSGESGEILKSELENLTAGTENYLNKLS